MTSVTADNSKIESLPPGFILEWRNETHPWKLLFPTIDTGIMTLAGAGWSIKPTRLEAEAAAYADWFKKRGVPCQAISLLAKKTMLLESPIVERVPFVDGEFAFLHLLIDGKVGWIVLGSWDLALIEIINS